MKQEILNALPETFAQIQRDRQQAEDRVKLLGKKLDEHRQRRDAAVAEVDRLAKEVAEVVTAGGEPAAQLKRIQANRNAIIDLQMVVELAEQAVTAAEKARQDIVKQQGEAFQKAVVEARNTVGAALQEDLNDVLAGIEAWRSVVYSTAAELALPAPEAGLDINLDRLR